MNVILSGPDSCGKTTLGEKLRDALNKIPWDKIKEVLRKIAKSIATFLWNKTLNKSKIISYCLFYNFLHEIIFI